MGTNFILIPLLIGDVRIHLFLFLFVCALLFSFACLFVFIKKNSTGCTRNKQHEQQIQTLSKQWFDNQGSYVHKIEHCVERQKIVALKSTT